MDILLDTHSYLRFVEGNSLLPEKAGKTITDARIVKFICMASLCETAIKTEINKLKLKIPFQIWKKKFKWTVLKFCRLNSHLSRN